MKNIFLIAKENALKHKSQMITRADIQVALNNVTIDDLKASTWIYEQFDLSFGLPEAKYTKEMLQATKKSISIGLESSLKKVFVSLKNSDLVEDIMNISKLNHPSELEEKYLAYANNRCRNIQKSHNAISSMMECAYKFDPSEAMEELGLPLEVIDDLLDDYVEQIFRTNIEFVNMMASMWEKNFLDEEFSFEPFKDLVHKNLGVAKNLRIQDAAFVLSELQKQSDLEVISLYLDALVSCAIKLKPKAAVRSALNSTIIELNSFKTSSSSRVNFFKSIKDSLS